MRGLKRRYGHSVRRTKRSEEILLNRKYRGLTIKIVKMHGLIVPRIYKGRRLEETLASAPSKFEALNRAARTIDAMLGD